MHNFLVECAVVVLKKDDFGAPDMTINLLLWLFLRFFIECLVGGLVTRYAFPMVCSVTDAKFERILYLVNFAHKV